jgi:UDP-MurNAc hydroxylase
MRFTILSHAGLVVEHSDIRVVCDPWLIGSCYWRSWWNFPEPDPDLIANLRADVIYLTHLHWDHFHGPSLRRFFRPETRVIVPKVITRRMVDDLHWLGFRNVEEIPHGATVELAPDFHLSSYQFGVTVDSALVLVGGATTLFNCNDAKLFGLPLAQVLRDHPKIDFILRSHSSAGPIPYCVKDYAQLLPNAPTQSNSADQFVRCALHVGARYAIPFASNHCFLHRETIGYNSTATTPEDVHRLYRKLSEQAGITSECVVMPPGSSWCDRDGFQIDPFDFTTRPSYIESMLARHQSALERTYAEEDAVTADIDSFRSYFQTLLGALPAWLRRRALPSIAFVTRDHSGRHTWLVDSAVGQVRAVDTAPEGLVTFEVHPGVLRDCAQKKMFSVWSASKRLSIRLPNAAALGTVNRWLTVLDLYELDMLPISRNLSLRALGIRLRRWREPVEVLRLLLRRALGRPALSMEAVYPVKAS